MRSFTTVDTFKNLEATFNETLINSIGIVYTNLVTHGLRYWIPLIVVLWFALEGWKMWFGMSKKTLQIFVFDTLKVVFVVAVALNSNNIGTNLSDNIMQWPDHLAGVVDGGEQVKSMKLLDGMMAMAYDTSEAIDSVHVAASGMFDFPNAKIWIISICVFILGMLNACIAGGIYLLAKFSMAILLSIGCIFIIFSLWDYTRSWFTAWLNYVVMCIILVLLVTLMVKFNYIIASKAFESIPDQLSDKPLLDCMNLLIVNVVGLIFLSSCPMIASALTSAGSLNMPDRIATRALGWGVNKIERHAPKTIKGVWRSGRNGVNRLRGNMDKNSVSGD